MSNLWKFRYYVLAKDGQAIGASDVKEAYDRGSKQVRSRFLSRVRTLASLPLNEWNEPLYKPLTGECNGLGEIRFKADNVQQRPLGFISGKLEFTILFWAREKGGKWLPLTSCDKAQKRKQEILKDRSRSHAIWLALE